MPHPDNTTTTATDRRTFAQRLQHAEERCAHALALLADARTAYCSPEGSGTIYRAALDRQADLRAKIDANQQTADAVQAKFKTLFAQAGHSVTKGVKAALFEKNDAASIAGELQIALQESEASSQVVALNANADAKDYRESYVRAHRAWVECQALRAVAEHGQALANAMTALAALPSADGSDAIMAAERPAWGTVWEGLQVLPSKPRHPCVRRPSTRSASSTWGR